MVVVNSATATTTRIYVAPVIAIHTPVIVFSVSSTPMVPLVECANQDSMEMLCDRIVKIADVTFWALIRVRDHAIIVLDNVHVYHTS